MKRNNFPYKSYGRQRLLEGAGDFDPRMVVTRWRDYFSTNVQGLFWMGFAEEVPVTENDLERLSESTGNEVKGLYYVLRGLVGSGGVDTAKNVFGKQRDIANNFLDAKDYRGKAEGWRKSEQAHMRWASRSKEERDMIEEPETIAKPNLTPPSANETANTDGTFSTKNGEKGIKIVTPMTRKSAFYAILFEDGTAMEVRQRNMISLCKSIQESVNDAVQTEELVNQTSVWNAQEFQMLQDFVGKLAEQDGGMITDAPKKGRGRKLSDEEQIAQEMNKTNMDRIRNAYNSSFSKSHDIVTNWNPIQSRDGQARRRSDSLTGLHGSDSSVGASIWTPNKEIMRVVGPKYDEQGNIVHDAHGKVEYEYEPIPFNGTYKDSKGNDKGVYVDENGDYFPMKDEWQIGDWDGMSDRELEETVANIHTALLKNVAFISSGDEGPTATHGYTFFGENGIPRPILNIASSHLSGRLNSILSVRDYINQAVSETGVDDYDAESFTANEEGGDIDDFENAEKGLKDIQKANMAGAMGYSKEVEDAMSNPYYNGTSPKMSGFKARMYKPTAESARRRVANLKEQRRRFLKNIVRESLMREMRRGNRRLF